MRTYARILDSHAFKSPTHVPRQKHGRRNARSCSHGVEAIDSWYRAHAICLERKRHARGCNCEFDSFVHNSKISEVINRNCFWGYSKHRNHQLLKCGRGYVCSPMIHAANCFCLKLLDLSFRATRQFASYSKKFIKILQFDFQIVILPKHTFFALPPPTLGSVAQTTHAWKFCSW